MEDEFTKIEEIAREHLKKQVRKIRDWADDLNTVIKRTEDFEDLDYKNELIGITNKIISKSLEIQKTTEGELELQISQIDDSKVPAGQSNLEISKFNEELGELLSPATVNQSANNGDGEEEKEAEDAEETSKIEGLNLGGSPSGFDVVNTGDVSVDKPTKIHDLEQQIAFLKEENKNLKSLNTEFWSKIKDMEEINKSLQFDGEHISLVAGTNSVLRTPKTVNPIMNFVANNLMSGIVFSRNKCFLAFKIPGEDPESYFGIKDWNQLTLTDDRTVVYNKQLHESNFLLQNHIFANFFIRIFYRCCLH